MGYEFLFMEQSHIFLDHFFGTDFALSRTSRRQKTMELIFAICITGLGLFGSMFFIWKGHHQ